MVALPQRYSVGYASHVRAISDVQVSPPCVLNMAQESKQSHTNTSHYRQKAAFSFWSIRNHKKEQDMEVTDIHIKEFVRDSSTEFEHVQQEHSELQLLSKPVV